MLVLKVIKILEHIHTGFTRIVTYICTDISKTRAYNRTSVCILFRGGYPSNLITNKLHTLFTLIKFCKDNILYRCGYPKFYIFKLDEYH